MSGELDRRTFLRRGVTTAAGAVLLGGVAPAVLAACGSDDDDGGGSASGGGGGDLQTVDFQFSWIKNVEFAGCYVADDRGYFREEGVQVNMMAGGPNVSTDPLLVSGKAFVGIDSTPDLTAAAVAQGAELKIVGVCYQKNPFAIVSLARNPIRTPQDLVGKSVGVQATNEVVWASFLKANNIDEGRVRKVPVQFDPTPLAGGEVDGWFSFVTNEPNQLKVKGVETASMLLDDFGYAMFAQAYSVRADTLTDDAKRERLRKFLRAEIRGWQDVLKDPRLAAELAVNKYGKDLGLDVEHQTLEATDQNKLITSPDTERHGILWMSDERIDATMRTIKAGGLDVKRDLFTNEILEEIYQGKATL